MSVEMSLELQWVEDRTERDWRQCAVIITVKCEECCQLR